MKTYSVVLSEINTFTGILVTLFLPTVHVKLFIRVQKTQLSRYLTYRNSLLAAPRPAGGAPPPCRALPNSSSRRSS